MRMNTAGDPKPESKGPETTRAIRLSTPVQYLPLVGQQKAALLEKLGLRRVVDLLFFFPRSYQDVAPTKKYQELQADVACSLLGTIESVDLRVYPDGRSSFGALLAVEGGGYVRLVWYNQPFRQKEIERGGRLIATGVPKPTGISWEMRHPVCQSLGPDEAPPPPKPQAIYPLTEGLQQRHLRSMIATAIEHCLILIPESLPESIRTERKLISISQALSLIHQPNSLAEAEQARYRFTFQELLVYQLAIAWRRHHLQHEIPAQAFVPTGVIHARILQRLGLDLTNDQQKAIDDIGKDMSRTIPMNRLVQGDVGSGKTVVAQYGMLLAAAYRSQVAFMAPTEILAIQHEKRLAQSLAKSQCHVELLTGSIQGRERRELLERIALGTVDIVVGTHALLSEKVDFANLGLVVIDEQHKFGVAQRAALASDLSQPHYLLLSATPIPRTLTMTAMGDMDVTILREKPPGRAPVHTYLGKPEQMTSWWSFVLKQVTQGRQAYVVVPRVVGDEEEDVKGAEQVFEELQNGPLAGLRMSLLHGRMDSEQKALALQEFSEGQTQVLVATTVIEVGIDIANATVMTILDADRLGLAQLHQLRGRVSRGTTPGYVCVFAKSGAPPEENARLSALANTDDGFKLAELDWTIRGPGSLLGTRQSGLPPFKIADLIRDAKIAEETHQVARAIIETDPTLASSEWTRIREQLLGKHGDMLEFGGVG
jgi:ATP-dependent DNA helicase RecG